MLKTKRRRRRMKMQRWSTGSGHLWNGKMKFSAAQSLACPPPHLAPVIPAGLERTHLWSSRMMKRSMSTLCCWPLSLTPGMKKQRRKTRKKDALRLNLHKDWIWFSVQIHREGKKSSLYIFHFVETSMVDLAVICSVVWMFSWVNQIFLFQMFLYPSNFYKLFHCLFEPLMTGPAQVSLHTNNTSHQQLSCADLKEIVSLSYVCLSTRGKTSPILCLESTGAEQICETKRLQRIFALLTGFQQVK